MNSFAKWTLGIVGSLLLVVAGFLLSGLTSGLAIFGSPGGTQAETVHTQVVAAIERTEQVSLVSLGIQGIEKTSGSTTFFGVVVPGSERTKFLQYAFDAKLGLDGGHVVIKQDSEKQFTITISEFTFIGYDNMHFELATESNGVLSWVTPEIDTAAMANSIMSTETKQKYIDANRELLRDQAESFYGGIIKAVDPTIDVTFDFGHA